MKKILTLVTVVALALGTLAEPIKVACIGDSITYGYGLNDRANTCYPNQLQILLNAKFPGKYEVRNFGNSGRGIYLDSMRGNEKRGFRFMKEHAAALEWKPDIVICNLGINDNGEYLKEHVGTRKRGQFIEDYSELLGDYVKVNPNTKFYMWTKLSPLTEGQRFYRSPEPFLMQADLEAVAKRFNARMIDMQKPLMADCDSIFAGDKIHPNASGAKIIAETTFKYLTSEAKLKVKPPMELKGKKMEIWLLAGQSNMQKGWGEFNYGTEEKARTAEELAKLDKLDVWLWDFNDDSWTKLTSKTAFKRSAFGVSFGIRRAEETGKSVVLLYVAAGGAPTEAFLTETTMCAVNPDGSLKYPNLAKIATNRHQINKNNDFPCAWCKREYQRRKGKAEEAYWWPVALMNDEGIKRIKHFPLTGILWYQGESNATTNVHPDVPLADDYMLETNLAIIDELRGGKDIPFIMMGLPKMNRPWEPYRAAQEKAAKDKRAIFVNTFAAGLGTPNDVHPRNKIPFAELAIKALKNAK